MKINDNDLPPYGCLPGVVGTPLSSLRLIAAATIRDSSSGRCGRCCRCRYCTSRCGLLQIPRAESREQRKSLTLHITSGNGCILQTASNWFLRSTGWLIICTLHGDLWYDEKSKLSSGGQSAPQLGGYAPLPTVIEDGSFALQPEKTANVVSEELLMDFECVYGNVELINQLTPPQTPPQSSAFGGVGGSVIPIEQQFSIPDSADSSYYGSRNDDDDEWSPAKNKKLNLSGGGAVTKKRTTGTTRPYGRGTEDKKSRKKEQNKNAATRYRQKKKAEIEEILVEENQLRDLNEELKKKSSDLGREISVLKKLMRELLRSKGLM
ncbi:hypothetical protein ZHAS_00014157 [Anopheles sinensis]|uniref:BZIP domain-containing protein n=1 Tax=Anopheles sinensis TaxID=74873 RepID=A0A084W7D7_ANOSI|nr:hypothetical protein ZHAS_00014157 [Anopheles sinensis]